MNQSQASARTQAVLGRGKTFVSSLLVWLAEKATYTLLTNQIAWPRRPKATNEGLQTVHETVLLTKHLTVYWDKTWPYRYHLLFSFHCFGWFLRLFLNLVHIFFCFLQFFFAMSFRLLQRGTRIADKFMITWSDIWNVSYTELRIWNYEDHSWLKFMITLLHSVIEKSFQEFGACHQNDVTHKFKFA